jgi:hypothetical protein
MDNILLNDLLGFTDDEIEIAKIRFNQFNGEVNPLEIFLNNPEAVNTNWFLNRTKNKIFKVGEIALCFIKLSKDSWLLTTIKKITKDLDVSNGINYEAEEFTKYQKYYGRVVINFSKGQNQSMYFKTHIDKLKVSEILPSIYEEDNFPGYDRVRLSYTKLANIIDGNKHDWVNALENQKAVYLITDIKTGKLYVGSATSEKGMLLNRWTAYKNNGHGGNEKLKELVNKEGFKYIKDNFQYTILENYNARVDDQIILNRESWWKETLVSRSHGYNGN